MFFCGENVSVGDKYLNSLLYISVKKEQSFYFDEKILRNEMSMSITISICTDFTFLRKGLLVCNCQMIL